jgi:hypothetical protein
LEGGDVNPDYSVHDALKSIGIGSMGLEKIKFGAGVVGKMTTSLIAFLSVLGVISLSCIFSGQVAIACGCIVACVAAFPFIIICMMIFASKHPATAMLEGTELVRYHQATWLRGDCPRQRLNQMSNLL